MAGLSIPVLYVQGDRHSDMSMLLPLGGHIARDLYIDYLPNIFCLRSSFPVDTEWKKPK
jgi:hypothetical protein